MSTPTLGYPSKTAAVIALSGEGKSAREIATLLGERPGDVRRIRNQARRDQRGRRFAEITADVAEELQAHAQRRSVTINKLAQIILINVVEDGLIEAVLDDANDRTVDG